MKEKKNIKRVRFSQDGLVIEYETWHEAGTRYKQCNCPDCGKQVDAEDMCAPFCWPHYEARFGKFSSADPGDQTFRRNK